MSLFRMPSLGSDMEGATLIEWLVAPGAEVHRGDLIAGESIYDLPSLLRTGRWHTLLRELRILSEW